jgi:hypothetical protein
MVRPTVQNVLNIQNHSLVREPDDPRLLDLVSHRHQPQLHIFFILLHPPKQNRIAQTINPQRVLARAGISAYPPLYRFNHRLHEPLVFDDEAPLGVSDINLERGVDPAPDVLARHADIARGMRRGFDVDAPGRGGVLAEEPHVRRPRACLVGGERALRAVGLEPVGRDAMRGRDAHVEAHEGGIG